MKMKSQVSTERTNDIAITSQVQQIEFVPLAENISSESDIDSPLCHKLQTQDDSLITGKNISHILQCEPNYMGPEQKNCYDAATNSDSLIANPYSTKKTLFLDKGSHSIEECVQNNRKFHKMDIKKQECKMETQILMKINAEKNNGRCKERKASKDYSLSHTNDDNISDSTCSNSDSCPICGDNATKYVHYGSRSCQACRAFFRRSATWISRSVR